MTELLRRYGRSFQGLSRQVWLLAAAHCRTGGMDEAALLQRDLPVAEPGVLDIAPLDTTVRVLVAHANGDRSAAERHLAEMPNALEGAEMGNEALFEGLLDELRSLVAEGQ